ncbi:MAG: PilZ domain-containing protein [Halobacteriovoraceae bacterium]|nr:PilZ domain-containing protein [Halobacteriovoraceae bacterium]MCB9095165.1 PilZ domain-containing protein [Halobacteriovoraceae bacterium]
MLNSLNTKKIQGTELFLKIIKKAVYDRSPIIAWFTKDKKRKIRNVRINSISTKDGTIGVTLDDMTDDFHAYIEGEKSLSFFITKNYVIFKLELEQFDAGNYFFKIPQNFLRLERRRSLRLYCDDEALDAKIKFKKMDREGAKFLQFEKDCNDYSTGGVSFNVRGKEATLFEEGELVKGIKITQKNLTFIVDGCVIYKKPVNSQTENSELEWRVGVEFLDLSPKQKVIVDNFIIKNLKSVTPTNKSNEAAT